MTLAGGGFRLASALWDAGIAGRGLRGGCFLRTHAIILAAKEYTKHLPTRQTCYLEFYKMAGKFEPKEPVQLDPPKDDPITLEELAKCNGKS